MKILTTALLTAGLAVAWLPALPAQAASNDANAVNLCQGALPNFEGSLRKRPLGINNEGTITAFVSCSVDTDAFGAITGIEVILTNRNASATTVNCTLVDGVAPPFPTPAPVYLPKSVSVPAGTFSVLVWNAADNGGNPYLLPNLSCALPVGTEINLVEVDF